MKVAASAAGVKASMALCDGEGVEGVLWWGAASLCVKVFWEVTPSCQSCLGSISGLFRGVNTPVQQPFCLRVRPRLPPSESWSQSQRAENTPH